jgi:3-methyl-2-oxobutanoate hydroxymethyltransferase
MTTFPSTPEPSESGRLPVTVPEIAAWKLRGGLSRGDVDGKAGQRGRRPIVMVTAYDAPSARAAESAGVDIVLVGDSLGMVVLGFDTTLNVTVDDLLRHTAAVTRSLSTPLVVADMPYLSFHISPEDSVRNAGRMIVEGGASAVKIEGGAKRVRTIEALLDAEIPVMGHIGLTPQSVNALGGFKVQGKVVEAAERLMEDAKALEAAGVFSIVLECVPHQLARIITESVTVPTIGIGAGPHCDGQVLVFHDIVGLSVGKRPKFVRTFSNLQEAATDALRDFAQAVVEGSFPDLDESYGLPEDVAAALEERYGSR